MNLTGIPRLPKRADGERRTVHEVDDIVSLVTFLDERKAIHQLPTYVADSPDSMPYLRMVDSDFKLLVKDISRIQFQLDSLMAAVDTTPERVYNLMREKFDAEDRGVINNNNDTVLAAGRGESITMIEGGYKQSTNVSGKTTHCVGRSTTNYSSVLLGSAVREQSEHDSQVDYSTEQEGDGRPFQTVVDRRRERKRRRVLSKDVRPDDQSSASVTRQQVGVSSRAVNQQPQQAPRPAKSTTTSRLIGKKRVDSVSLSSIALAAAKPYISKAVYCVDNVATTLSGDDLTRYVIAMGVSVISCHKVRPRRSAWQRQAGITPTDRNTFRLCVAREDVDKLLKAENWPEHISVSSWTFIKPQQQQQRDNTTTASASSDAAVSRTAKTSQAGLSSTDVATDVTVAVHSDNDATDMDTATNYQHGVDNQ